MQGAPVRCCMGADTADSFIGDMIGGAILPSLLHQDPRYFYKGTGTVRSRIGYAFANAVVCKGDNMRWQFNFSGILGSLAAGGISNLYYPENERSDAVVTFEGAGIGLAGAAVQNMLQEFLIKKLTPHANKDRVRRNVTVGYKSAPSPVPPCHHSPRVFDLFPTAFSVHDFGESMP